jgi:hypothetical protein
VHITIRSLFRMGYYSNLSVFVSVDGSTKFRKKNAIHWSPNTVAPLQRQARQKAKRAASNIQYGHHDHEHGQLGRRLPLKCDGSHAETRFHRLAKRASPFKPAGAPVQSTRYTMFRGSVNGTVYPLHSPVSPSLPLPCVTVSSHFNWALPQ